MIEIDGLTKRYGDKTAVDGLSFVVEPGVVTGFLGPNGAGKSTTMRVIAGLDRPTSGTVRVNGKHYPGAAAPMAELGILLDARSVHPGLSARGNLLALARTAGIGRRRVDEVIELAGLGEVAGTRAGGFSLGMGQRLGVAAALLGRPQTVVLDEPVNGLDPDGVRWIRLLLKSLAAEGRTVFVSSHLMSEMAQTATRLVVLGRGRLITETSVADFTGHATAGAVLVRTPETGRLRQVLAGPGVTVTGDGTDLLRVSGITAGQIGTAAWRAHLPVYELTPVLRGAGRRGLPSAPHHGVHALPAVQRRRGHLGSREAVRRAAAEPVGRIRRAVRLRGRADRPGRLAAAPPRRLNTRTRAARKQAGPFRTPAGNPGTRPPRSRALDIGARPARRQGVVQRPCARHRAGTPAAATGPDRPAGRWRARGRRAAGRGQPRSRTR